VLSIPRRGRNESSDSRALATLIERERDTLIAEWRRRARTMPARGEADAQIPALLGGGAPAAEDAAWLDGLIAALKRDVAGETGGTPAGSALPAGVPDIAALRGCLLDLAAQRTPGLSAHARDVLNHALDERLCSAVRSAVRRETAARREAREEQLVFLAHDLKAPLNAIALAADALDGVLSSASDTALATRMLGSVRRNVEQISALAAQVLDTRAPDDFPLAPTPRPVELWPLVRSVVQELEPVARLSGARVVNAVPESLVAHADSELLARVFQNLIANAIDHAPGGEILIGAEVSSPGGGVVCWVRDDGAGIASHEIERMFRKGASTRSDQGSRGLGLPIVEQVVEAHGGRIAVESAEGFGATFWFELPAADGAQVAAHRDR